MWKSVAYASRSMSDTEKCYTQIAKEVLAVMWSYDKFSSYILRRHFNIEMDHKPLFLLLSTKHLDNLPPHILRFHLRLAWYDYSIHHVPGKYLYTAETLSRALVTEMYSLLLQEEVEEFIECHRRNLSSPDMGSLKFFGVTMVPIHISRFRRHYKSRMDF